MADEGKVVRVVFDSAADTPAHYTNTLVVQHDQHDFTITFFDVRPPLLMGSAELKEQQLSEIEAVRARCVGRFIVAASRMHEFVQVMQDNLRTFQATSEKKEQP